MAKSMPMPPNKPDRPGKPDRQEYIGDAKDPAVQAAVKRGALTPKRKGGK